MENDNIEISKNIFKRHYDCYNNHWIETVKQQAGQVEQVSYDYQGRVIFELLQNAFDKADKNIIVKVVGDILYIANDGVNFTYTYEYDYENNSTIRGDFQSLCSISTSTKNVANSIGNKGVGFKSVFSIAEDGFVNIHTLGKILFNEKEPLKQKISFRVFDSFKSTDIIPNELDDVSKLSLKNKIKLIQEEYSGRGVPGYYYPIQIHNKNEIINDLYKSGYVTIIEIPFGEKNRDEVKNLIDEIENTHFDFVRIKYDKIFFIKLEYDDTITELNVNKGKENIFTAILNNTELTELGNKLNIQLNNTVVAFCINNKKTGGKLYNYLPTKVESPFKHIDFHADFQTKVDRTNINLDDNGDVGKYNIALYQACLELLFYFINSYLDKDDRVVLNYKWINDKTVIQNNLDFDWSIIEVANSRDAFIHVKFILKLYDRSYDTVSELFTKLAKKYFSHNRTIEEYHLFYNNISIFLDNYVSNTSQYSLWVGRCIESLSKKLLNESINLLPNIKLNNNTEVFYKKNNEASLSIPEFLDVSITDFEIKDQVIRKELRIKDFEEYNEILKYYKQVKFNGNFLKESISEDMQIELLKSLYTILKSKKEFVFYSTHRYLRVFTAEDRKNNSTTNQAYFNISTIFLKLKNRKYKPAQLCRKIDLDTQFLDAITNNSDIDFFLQFIGVSLDANFIFCDKRIYNKLNNGVNYIPALIKHINDNEKLYGEALLKNVNVISAKKKSVHPALINDNNYDFLENINVKGLQNEFDCLRVKKYNEFPKEYIDILYSKIINMPIDISRFYSNIFHSLHSKLNIYLITTKGNLSWKTSSDIFYIVRNRFDFDILCKQDIPLLNYYNGNEIPYELHDKIIELIENEISSEISSNVTHETINLLENRMCYMLATVSSTSFSELNFVNNLNKIKEIRNLLSSTEIFNCSALFRQITDNKSVINFNIQSDALFDRDKKKIYFINNCSNKIKAEIFSKYFFNNNSISSSIELILYFKDPEELELDLINSNLQLFKKNWVLNYKQQFSKFINELLNGLIDSNIHVTDNWYIHNKNYKSEILINLFKNKKLNELELRLQKLNEKYNGLFDDFRLEIDYSYNDIEISKLIKFLETYHSEKAFNYIKDLKEIAKSIGRDDDLIKIKNELIEKFNYSESILTQNNNVELIQSKIELERNVDLIFDKIQGVNTPLQINEFIPVGNSNIQSFDIKPKKLIFQNNTNDTNLNFLVQTGVNGEEQVLGYYINLFLELDFNQREKAIEEIYELIVEKLGNNSHLPYKENCLLNLNIDIQLKKALIPFFYITMHHKFSYFDIIAYQDSKPAVIEVKTTNNSNNTSFFISIAEINEALKEPNYQIIRVTPNEMIFMGNPIKELHSKLTSISGDNYKMIPRNYKFEFKKSQN